MTIFNDYAPLIEYLKKTQASVTSYSALCRRTKELGFRVSNASIGAIADGSTKEPALKIWDILHKASPEYIRPAPRIEHAPPVSPRSQENNADYIPNSPSRAIPVFNAGAGKDCSWSDKGYPIGKADQYITLPIHELYMRQLQTHLE